MPASRVWRYDIDPNAGKPILELSPQEIDFEYVYPYASKSLPLTINNITEQRREITKATFGNFTAIFTADDAQFPITLAPAGALGSSAVIMVTFRARQFGEFEDIMTLGSITNPVLIIKGKVPTVYCPDQNFGDKIIGGPLDPKSFRIRNDGWAPAVIKSARLESQSGIFKIESNFPITIQKESFKDLLISFFPQDEISYTDKVIFEISAEGIVDSVMRVTGRGIR